MLNVFQFVLKVLEKTPMANVKDKLLNTNHVLLDILNNKVIHKLVKIVQWVVQLKPTMLSSILKRIFVNNVKLKLSRSMVKSKTKKFVGKEP